MQHYANHKNRIMNMAMGGPALNGDYDENGFIQYESQRIALHTDEINAIQTSNKGLTTAKKEC